MRGSRRRPCRPVCLCTPTRPDTPSSSRGSTSSSTNASSGYLNCPCACTMRRLLPFTMLRFVCVLAQVVRKHHRLISARVHRPVRRAAQQVLPGARRDRHVDEDRDHLLRRDDQLGPIQSTAGRTHIMHISLFSPNSPPIYLAQGSVWTLTVWHLSRFAATSCSGLGTSCAT